MLQNYFLFLAITYNFENYKCTFQCFGELSKQHRFSFFFLYLHLALSFHYADLRDAAQDSIIHNNYVSPEPSADSLNDVLLCFGHIIL